MIVGFRLYANDLFDVEHVLLNAEIVLERAAKKADALLFADDSFIDRLARNCAPPGVPVWLCTSCYEDPPKGVAKVVKTFRPDYTVYVFDTEPPPMHGRRLVVNLKTGTEQWILD